MDLDELRVFVAVAEHGSLLEASRALRLARTTLRRRLESLSARIGVTLYTATATGIAVTEAGQALLHHGRDVLANIAAITSAIQEVARGPSGLLRVVMPAGMPPQAAIPLYADLRRRFPALKLKAHVAEDPLTTGEEVDLILHFGERPARGAYITRRLFAMRVWLVASPRYLERAGTPTSVEDLADHHLLIWTGLGETSSLPLIAGGHVPIAPALESRDIHMLRQCALNGLGIAFVPDALLPDPSTDGPPLVPVLPELVGAETALWTAIPEALRDAPRVRAMLASLMDVVPEASAGRTAKDRKRTR